MGRLATRSAFAAALCAGVGMVGVSVQGLLDVDAQLQRSVLAAQEQQPGARAVSFRVSLHERDGSDCRGWSAPRSRERA